MISNSGRYWSTGITLHWTDRAQRDYDGTVRAGWGGTVDFMDDGFCDDDADKGQVSTQGRLSTRYAVADGEAASGLRAAIDTLLADAAKLGIELRGPDGPPCLFYDGDGENADYPPPAGWRELLTIEAQRLDWSTPYSAASKEA